MHSRLLTKTYFKSRKKGMRGQATLCDIFPPAHYQNRANLNLVKKYVFEVLN